MGLVSDITGRFANFTSKISKYINGDFTHATAAERKQMAQEVRKAATVCTLGLSMQPIPFADVLIITPFQVLMVRTIGNIYGYKLSARTTKETLSVIGGGIVGQQLCLALFKIGLPGAGGLGGAVFVFCWTHAMGCAAEAYFSSGMKASREELEGICKAAMKEAMNDYKSSK